MLLRRSPPFLPAALFAGLFAAVPPAQSATSSPPSPRRMLSEASAKVLRERMGGESFAVLAAWLRAPRDRQAPPPAWLPRGGGPADAAFHELVHAALGRTTRTPPTRARA